MIKFATIMRIFFSFIEILISICLMMLGIFFQNSSRAYEFTVCPYVLSAVLFGWLTWLVFDTPIFCPIAYAGINEDLNNFFDHLGFSNNVTGANAYLGQQAGYYTGGSLFARDSVREVQIAQIDLPSVRSGCGGIDLFTGGFSFINSQELIHSMRNILNNSAGYAFNLALESVTPEIANSMKYFNTLASSVNQMNINSCETAAGLVGSLWPRTRVAEQQVCQEIGTSRGIFSDYAAARQGCGNGGQMTSTVNSAQGAYKNLVFRNVNIAWKALQQNSFLQSDPQLAEFLMSLSGTIILSNPGNSDNSPPQFTVKDSLANQSLLKALFHGGRARIYQCDNYLSNGCLDPKEQTIIIPQDHGLASQVSHLLHDIVDKIRLDKPLNASEIGFLNATRLPIYKMLNVQVAFAKSPAILDTESYAELIAIDILFQYLDENLAFVRTSSASLQYPEYIMAQYMQNLYQAQMSVREAEESAYKKVVSTAQLIQQTQSLEQMLVGSLSVQLHSTLSWANGLK